MSALNSGLFLVSAVASGSGLSGLSQESFKLRTPKKMKRLAGMYYGRLESYAAALEAKDRAALAAALKRNFHPEGGDAAPAMEALATYLLTVEAQLADVGEEVVETGQLQIPSAGA